MNVALGLGLLDASTLLGTLGLLGVLGAVVIETGLLVGFFLPGDSLLFTAGVFAAQSHPFAPLWLLLLTVPAAAIVGDQLGFLIGRRAGDTVFHRPSAKRIGPKQLEQSRRFFDRYGPRTILLARFVPVARTIAPVMAGASGMRYRTFAVYNVVGGIAWGVGVPVLGYLLGGIAFVRGHIEVILIAVVLVSILPLLINGLRARRRGQGAVLQPDSIPTPTGEPGQCARPGAPFTR
jgi:membrane-associated protein